MGSEEPGKQQKCSDWATNCAKYLGSICHLDSPILGIWTHSESWRTLSSLQIDHPYVDHLQRQMVHILLVLPSVTHDIAFSHFARLLDGRRRRKPVYPIGGIGLTGTSLP